MKRVLINHGWTNRRPAEHWQHLTATALRQQGHQVQYPQYPDTDLPNLAAWQELLVAELQQQIEISGANPTNGDGERIAIAHSLGCVNWIHAALAGAITEPVDRLLLVAPADPVTLGELPDFQFDLGQAGLAEAVRATAGSITLVGSDQDSWAPSGLQASFGNALGVEAVIIPGAGHLALGDGWGPWAGVINWVNDSEASLSVR